MNRPGEPLDPLSEFDDYSSGHMPEQAAADYEEQLFARAAEGAAPEAAFVDQLTQSARWLQKRGLFAVGSTRPQVEAIWASGLRVHHVEFGSGGVVDIAPLPAGTEVFTYRLDVDMRGVDRIDVLVETPDGEHVKTFRDVTHDPETGNIYGVCEAPLAELSFRRGTVVSKVMGTRAGERKLLARFETRPAGVR
jgi:hypothetical protein